MYEFATRTVGLVVLMFFVQEAETRARVVLTADPQRSNVWSGETVRLTCKVEDSDPSTQWEYSWKKLRENKETTLSSYTGEGFSAYTLSHVTESDSAQYRCEAKVENREIISSPHTLTVTREAPKPLLTLNPPSGEIFTGHTVTLSCRAGTDPAGWEYLWFKETLGAALTNTDSSSTDGSSYTIQSAAVSHGGEYWCLARRGSPPVYTPYSDSLQLSITALPSVVLTLQPGWTHIFNRERAALHCDIQDRSPVWMHKWYRDGQELPVGTAEDTYEILSAVQSDSGTYTCKGQHNEGVLYTGSSNMVALKVNGEAPKPLLTLDPHSGEIFTGDTVTMSCRVGTDPAGWEYLWYKETRGAALTSTDSSSTNGSSCTIHSAAVSHGGEYWCRAWRGKPPFYTPYSDSLQLSITAPPPAVLSLNPAWTKFYPTEKVTLKCEIQSRQTGWSYLWYRDGAAINSALSISGNEYTIQALDQSHSGRYSCKGAIPGRAVYTEMSKDVTLTVDARPQAVLTLETAWTEIFRTDSLTLRCQVEGSSAEWNYTWYRDGRHLPLDPSGDRLTLTAGNDSYSSEYKCRGNRTGQPSYTEISEGFRENNIVSCTVENLARIAVGAAILLFLSVIVNEGFWRRARKMRRCCI